MLVLPVILSLLVRWALSPDKLLLLDGGNPLLQDLTGFSWALSASGLSLAEEGSYIPPRSIFLMSFAVWGEGSEGR